MKRGEKKIILLVDHEIYINHEFHEFHEFYFASQVIRKKKATKHIRKIRVIRGKKKKNRHAHERRNATHIKKKEIRSVPFETETNRIINFALWRLKKY